MEGSVSRLILVLKPIKFEYCQYFTLNFEQFIIRYTPLIVIYFFSDESNIDRRICFH